MFTKDEEKHVEYIDSEDEDESSKKLNDQFDTDVIDLKVDVQAVRTRIDECEQYTANVHTKFQNDLKLIHECLQDIDITCTTLLKRHAEMDQKLTLLSESYLTICEEIDQLKTAK